MNEEHKALVYDPDLQLKAYHFQGLTQPFPNHFHGYYVIRLVEHGTRRFFVEAKCTLYTKAPSCS